jgi:D-alanyl-D-alanine endopeptidase (penicillin-binding protein 7)
MTEKDMKRIVGSFLALLFLLFPAQGVGAATKISKPVLKKGASIPAESSFTASSILVIDAKSGAVLYEKSPNLLWPTASITKIMSSVIFLEQKPNMASVVALTDQDEVGGGRLRVETGTTLTKKDLLYCALVGSANNTATAMMNNSGLTRKAFIKEMNIRAKVLGMHNTTYVDASGMDVQNTTTAADVAILAKYAFANSTIQRAAQTANYRFSTIKPVIDKTIKNTNALLLDPDNDLWILAGKTGYLEEARNNLVVRVQTMQKTKELIVVVLGASTKQHSFSETESLTKWAWKNYAW